jgi:site-specific DNA-cytosine methylase
MIVLSLFDGMACGYEALKRAGIPVTKYYASEIDKNAMQIAKKNHPDIIHLGDVTQWQSWDIETPDLIIGGSPCQGFSFAGKQLAFNDPRSALFFTMVDIINHYQPRFKLLENVKMKKEYMDVITHYMGCEPMFINSALVSAQNRQRYYWFNWDAPTPEDEGILLKDIIEHGFVDRNKSFCVDANYFKGGNIKSYFEKSRRQLVFEKPHGFNKGGFKEKNKFSALRVCTKDNYATLDGVTWRKITPIECERLQTLPDNYTEGVSNTQRYRMLGNGWTVDVIAHIFKYIKEIPDENKSEGGE